MYNILLYITFGCIRLVSRIPEIILVLWKLIPKLLYTSYTSLYFLLIATGYM